MSTSTKERPRIARPGSGVAVDPSRVMIMRWRRGLTRDEVSDRIAALGLRTDRGRPVSLKRDAVGKVETGQRRPSELAMEALCQVLECAPADLMPGGAPLAMPRSAKVRAARLDHNRELRDFAIRHGLRYKNPKTGRIYYKKALREAYAAHVAAVLATGSGDPEQAAAAEETASAALDAAVRTLRVADPECGDRKAS